MATPTNHWKLGLFVVVSVLIAMAVVVALSARTLTKETVDLVTYFDESVQGLELGAPVKFRGVTIGKVSAIDIASDGRHVQATCQLIVQQLKRLNLGEAGGDSRRLAVPPELRVQLASTGLTGVKFILIDFFDPKTNPPPKLPFAVPENYIPTAPSTMKNLEDSLVRTVHRFPELADELMKTLGKLNGLLDDVTAKKLPERALDTLAQTNGAMSELQKQLAQLDAKQLSAGAQQSLVNLNVTLTKTNRLLDNVQGERGLLASAQRTSDAMGDMARNTNSLSPEFEETLRDIAGAAQSIRRLANALERDPDMLIKGRAKAER
jgi:paraquat-inducible protein B